MKAFCPEPGCTELTTGRRCKMHELQRRREAEAADKAVVDYDILYDRAQFKSFAEIARKHGVTRQRIQQRIDIAVRRQDIHIVGYHPAEIRAGLIEKIGPAAVARLRPIIEPDPGT